MLTISVDPGYAFDYLSILEVKGDTSGWNRTAEELERQVKDFDLLINSSEYHAVRRANSDVFNLVSMASTDRCKASDVDRANQARFFAKKRFQDKFFPGSTMTEVKTSRWFDKDIQ